MGPSWLLSSRPPALLIMRHKNLTVSYFDKCRQMSMRGITNVDTRQVAIPLLWLSGSEFCGLRLMVRVEVLGSVKPNPNPNTNPNLNPNPNQKPLA